MMSTIGYSARSRSRPTTMAKPQPKTRTNQSGIPFAASPLLVCKLIARERKIARSDSSGTINQPPSAMAINVAIGCYHLKPLVCVNEYYGDLTPTDPYHKTTTHDRGRISRC